MSFLILCHFWPLNYPGPFGLAGHKGDEKGLDTPPLCTIKKRVNNYWGLINRIKVEKYQPAVIKVKFDVKFVKSNVNFGDSIKWIQYIRNHNLSLILNHGFSA